MQVGRQQRQRFEQDVGTLFLDQPADRQQLTGSSAHWLPSRVARCGIGAKRCRSSPW
jgi:hypothetical protein